MLRNSLPLISKLFFLDSSRFAYACPPGKQWSSGMPSLGANWPQFSACCAPEGKQFGENLVPWEPLLLLLMSWVGTPTCMISIFSTQRWQHFSERPLTSVDAGPWWQQSPQLRAA